MNAAETLAWARDELLPQYAQPGCVPKLAGAGSGGGGRDFYAIVNVRPGVELAVDVIPAQAVIRVHLLSNDERNKREWKRIASLAAEGKLKSRQPLPEGLQLVYREGSHKQVRGYLGFEWSFPGPEYDSQLPRIASAAAWVRTLR